MLLEDCMNMAVLLCQVFALQDASVYELIHEMLSGRQRPDKVEPLQVVVDEQGLHIVRGHRRGLALCALQGIWRDRTVLTPCRLYKANDPEVAKQFANMDTVVDGLSIQLHGKCPEAWHRGKPLFRTAEEWCDSVADMPMHSLRVRPESQAAGFNKLDLQDSRRSEPFSANAQLSHRGTMTKELSADGSASKPKGSLADETRNAWRCRAIELDPPSATSAAHPNKQTKIASMEGSTELKEGMVVCVTGSGPKMLSGEVLDFSRVQGVKVRYTAKGPPNQCHTKWLPLDRLKVPDYSGIKQGMQATVLGATGSKSFYCTVLQVSEEKDRARAPVHVHYNGRTATDDEWVGAERIRSKLLKLHEPTLPDEKVKREHPESQEQRVLAAPLGGQSLERDASMIGAAQKQKGSMEGSTELKEGMVVCVTGSGPKMLSGEVLDFSRVQGVKVRYTAKGPPNQCHTKWLPLDRLKVPDYSGIKQGMQATVLGATGSKSFYCTVLQVSEEKDRARAPVHVHYNGRTATDDEWVGAERIRSKLLKLHEPTLPDEKAKREHPESQEQRVLAAPLGGQSLERDASMIGAAQRPDRSSGTTRVSDGFDIDDKDLKPLSLTDGVVDGSKHESQHFLVSDSAESKVVCCRWLAGKCWRQGHHFLGTKLHLHEAVPGLKCGFGTSCECKHVRKGTTSVARDAELKEGMVVCVTGSGPKMLSGEVLDFSRVQGVKVRYTAKGPPNQCHTKWLPLDRLKVPDYSGIKQGMQATVLGATGSKSFYCTVLQVSEEKDRARAPVHVHYNGRTATDDEWVGAERIRSKLLKLHEPTLPDEKAKREHPESQEQRVLAVPLGGQSLERDASMIGAAQRPDRSSGTTRVSDGFDIDDKDLKPLSLTDGVVDGSKHESQHFLVSDSAESKVVCCRWLAGKCWRQGHHFLGTKLHLHEAVPGLKCGFGTSCECKHVRKGTTSVARDAELKEGMVVCVTGSGPKMLSGEVLDFSRVQGVKVRYTAKGPPNQCHTKWLPLDRLKVPDYSGIKQGMQATVLGATGSKSFYCTVLQVSEEKDRAKAPILVHYNGRTATDDEWVGADRFRSKLLKLHEPRLPDEKAKREHPDSREGQRMLAVTSRPGSTEPDGEPCRTHTCHTTAEGWSTRALPWCDIHDSEADASDAADSPRSDRPLGPREEDRDSDSDMYSELSIPPSNAIESSCAAAPNDWEERMARQTLASDDVILESMQNNQSSDREVLKVWITAADIVVLNRIDLQGAVTVLLTKEFKGTGSDYLRPVTLDSLKQLLGLVVFGTCRSTTGKEVLKSGLASQIHRIQPNHAKSITTSRAQVRFSGTPNMM